MRREHEKADHREFSSIALVATRPAAMLPTAAHPLPDPVISNRFRRPVLRTGSSIAPKSLRSIRRAAWTAHRLLEPDVSRSRRYGKHRSIPHGTPCERRTAAACDSRSRTDRAMRATATDHSFVSRKVPTAPPSTDIDSIANLLTPRRAAASASWEDMTTEVSVSLARSSRAA